MHDSKNGLADFLITRGCNGRNGSTWLGTYALVIPGLGTEAGEPQVQGQPGFWNENTSQGKRSKRKEIT